MDETPQQYEATTRLPPSCSSSDDKTSDDDLAESVDKTTEEEEEEELSTWVRDQEDEKEMDEMPPDADDLVGTPVLTTPAPQKQRNINPVEMQQKTVTPEIGDDLFVSHALSSVSNKKAMTFDQMLKKQLDYENAKRGRKRGKVNIGTLTDAIFGFFAVALSGRWLSTKVVAIIDVAFNLVNLKNVAAKNVASSHLRRCVSSHMRSVRYIPWKMLRSIDLASGAGLNYSALDHIRKVEDPFEREQCAMPSATTVKRRAKELEDASEYHFHMEMKDTAYGPVYYFNHEELTRFLFDQYDVTRFLLPGSTGPKLRVGFTLDAMTLSSNLTNPLILTIK
jgi:hypothetical protein